MERVEIVPERVRVGVSGKVRLAFIDAVGPPVVPSHSTHVVFLVSRVGFRRVTRFG